VNAARAQEPSKILRGFRADLIPPHHSQQLAGGGAMSGSFSRRTFLQMLAGATVAISAAPASASAAAGEARIARLIGQARALPTVSERIAFISRALVGTRYRAHTLIGGPRRPERFVVRDDAFDCVTFCETVLAAALAREPAAFEAALRAIRYHNGTVSWRDRNHYFFEWGRHNIANGTCRAVELDGAVDLAKTVYWHKALGRRRFAMRVIPRAAFLAGRDRLANGDIVGFVTRRPNLDYFHTGFVVFGPRGELLLRHASQGRGRVVDERMERFAAANRVRYVTLLRPLEPAALSV